MKVYLIGDIMLDEYHFCELAGTSPEAPVLQLKDCYSQYQFGGAGNVAMNIAAMERDDLQFKVLGPFPTRLPDPIPASNHKCFADSFSADWPGCIKTRFLAGDVPQQILRVDNDTSFPEEKEEEFREFIRRQRKARVGIASDYLHGAVTRKTLKALSSKSDVVIADPKGKHWYKYQGLVDIITPNRKEVLDLVPNASSESIAAKQLGQNIGCLAVILKKGEHGCSVYMKDGQEVHIEAHRTERQVVDVTGAGDTFISTLAVSIARGVPLLEGVQKSTIMAGESVTHPGCFVPREEDIENVFPTS